MAFFPSLTKTWHTESYPAISPSRSELSVRGKVVVVTGGGSGIGASITRAFAAGGATKLAILSRSLPKLVACKNEIEETYPGTEILTLAADITNAEQVNDAFSKIDQTFGKIDILVCNSAFMPAPTRVLDPDLDVGEWWMTYTTNVLGALHTVRAFAKFASSKPQVLHISSCMGHVPPLEPGISAYSASKSAAAKVFDYLAFEYPELHVVNVHPGLVDTETSRKSGHGGTDHSEYPFASSLSLQNTDQTPVDLSGDFCVWLCSPEAAFLRGKFVWVNWDVEELVASKEEILSTDILDTKLGGVSFTGFKMGDV